jgi:uncharacterized protein YjbI with pentapeptide repeats
VRIFKPLQLSLQTRTFRWQQKNYMSVSYLLGFRFDDSREILLEQALWQFLGDRLDSDTPLDIGMPKPHGEVLVFGDYYAPDGQAVSADAVQIKAGTLDKTLAVIGERYWRPLIGPTPPETFTRMPVDYVHAFGGTEHAFNPFGKGIEKVDVFGEKRLPLPNIEKPDKLITDSSQRPLPAGLAPLDMMWQQRAAKMGTYDDDWQINHFPGYPPDLDWMHFMCAPEDQWLPDFWRGDEDFSIRNMHPQKPQLNGKLPAFRARCFIENEKQANFRQVEMKAETVFLYPGDETGILIYRGSIEVEQDDASEIEHLLVAYEDLAQEPLSEAWYEQALRNRLDEDKVFKYMMNTQDIIPASERCGFALMLEQAGEAGDSAIAENMENRKNAELEKVAVVLEEQKQALKLQLENAGVDPTPHLQKFDLSKSQPVNDPMQIAINETLEKMVPGTTGGDNSKVKATEIDLSQVKVLEQQVKDMAEAKKQAVKDQLMQVIDEAKGSPQETQIREKMEAAIIKIDARPDLPRPSGQAMVDNLKQQVSNFEQATTDMRARGVAEDKIPRLDVNIEEACEKLELAFVHAREGYRMGAHNIEGSPPHDVPLDIVLHRFKKTIEKGEPLVGLDLSGLDLSGLDFSKRDLSDCYLEYANLSRANFSGAILDGAVITHANLSQTNFSGASLQKANLGGSKLAGADLTDAITTGMELSKADLQEAKIINCDLAKANFIETSFAGADLSGSNLSEANFVELDFAGARFVGCTLTSCNFIKGQMLQVDFSEAIIDESNFVECVCDDALFTRAKMNNVRFVGGCSLRRCNFDKAILDKANFRDCEAERSSFEEASFYMADFSGANLQHTKFYGASGKRAMFIKSDLLEADFSSVNLMEGSLMKARLTNADLSYSNLYAVEFMNATVGGTDFRQANLDLSKLENWSPPHDA